MDVDAPGQSVSVISDCSLNLALRRGRCLWELGEELSLVPFNIFGQTKWIVVCWKLEHMRAAKEDKLRRLAEMKAARMLHRSLEGKRACELLRNINKGYERERSVLHCFVTFAASLNERRRYWGAQRNAVCVSVCLSAEPRLHMRHISLCGCIQFSLVNSVTVSLQS